jgi:hypothetical protein
MGRGGARSAAPQIGRCRAGPVRSNLLTLGGEMLPNMRAENTHTDLRTNYRQNGLAPEAPPWPFSRAGWGRVRAADTPNECAKGPVATRPMTKRGILARRAGHPNFTVNHARQSQPPRPGRWRFALRQRDFGPAWQEDGADHAQGSGHPAKTRRGRCAALSGPTAGRPGEHPGMTLDRWRGILDNPQRDTRISDETWRTQWQLFRRLCCLALG